MRHAESSTGRRRAGLAVLATAVLFSWAGPALPEGADAEQKVAAIKQSLQTGSAALRKYEWVETTKVSRKGEEKSTKQNQCYYGADGTLQKIAVASDSGQSKKKPRGLRGKMVKKKTADITEYMTEASTLVKQYVPPDPGRIQAAKDAGNMALKPLSGGEVQLEFRDYLKPGDVLSIFLDPSSNALRRVHVSTYVDKAADVVTLDVTMTTLPDGALYPSEIDLVAESKEIEVDIRNSGHRLMNAGG